MKNLYQIKEEYLKILDKIGEAEGEVTEATDKELYINETELQDKAINYAKYIKSVEDENSIIKKETDRLKALETANKTKIKKLKDIVSNAMVLFGMERIESETMKLSLRESQSVEILDESKLSPKFFTETTTKSVSKAVIKKALHSGDVAGARLQTNNNLQIK